MTSTRTRRLQPVVGRAPRRSRAYWLASGLGLAACMALLAVVVATEPDTVGEPDALPPLTVAATGDEDGDQTTDTAAEPVALPLVSYELFLARDPFEPVVPEPEPEDPVDPADPADPAAPTDPADPADPAAPTPGTGVTNGPCTGDVEVVCDGRVLSVVEIFEVNGELVAVIQVDTMRYEVRAGDTFADVFEVVSITPDEVRLLFGDRVVRIRVGDNALK